VIFKCNNSAWSIRAFTYSNLPGFGVAGADRTENGIGYKSLVSSTPGE
jgi:hypothetical protein